MIPKFISYNWKISINRDEHDIKVFNGKEYFISKASKEKFRVFFRIISDNGNKNIFYPWGGKKFTSNSAKNAELNIINGWER